MDIDKDKLSEKFIEQDWDYVFKEAKIIVDYLLFQNFKIYNNEIRNDMSQECLLNFYKKITQGKVDPQKNLFAFIWKNSTFRVLEILRKERKRKSIATFIPYDTIEDENKNYYFDSKGNVGYKYIDNSLKELWAV